MTTSTPPPPPPKPPTDDKSFWHRMNSPSPSDDHPSTLPSPPPPHPLELLVSTPAGKPLLHYYHLHPRHPQSISTLSAASTALLHAHPNLSLIRNSSITALFLRTPALHVLVSASHPNIPHSFLRALARIATHAIYMTLSTDLDSYLTDKPNAHIPSHTLAPAQRWAQVALDDALAHPLPFCLAPLSLPCPNGPSSRAGLVHVVRAGMEKWRGGVHYALVFTASPPFPRRVILTGGSRNRELSGMDMCMLMSLVSKRREDGMERMERVYLQSGGFGEACEVVARAVELRLRAEDFDEFKQAVGGEGWRPEWNSDGGGVVWVMAVVRKGMRDDGEEFLRWVEDGLDRKRWTKDLMVCMERPWGLRDIKGEFAPGVRDVIRGVWCVGGRRIIATVGGGGWALGWMVLSSLADWENREAPGTGLRGIEKGKEWVVVKYREEKSYVVVWEGGYVVCFDDTLGVEEGVVAMQKAVVPWMKRFRGALLPQHDRAIVPPKTPLAGILAPFQT